MIIKNNNLGKNMPEALFLVLQNIEESAKNLSKIADNVHQRDLKLALAKLIGNIVASIDYDIIPIVKKNWPDHLYRSVE